MEATSDTRKKIFDLVVVMYIVVLFALIMLHHAMSYVYIIHGAGRPGSSEVPRNLLTRWDVSSIPANGIFLTKKLKTKIKMPNGWRTIKSLVHKIRLQGRRGKGTAESSREKN